MDADVVAVPADDAGRLTGDALRATVDGLDADDRARLFAVVATSGTTNAGVDRRPRPRPPPSCAELGTWLHVDGAYGGAALAAPSVRARFDGIEARRQLHRRPAQVAVRPVRLVRPAVPRPGDRPPRPHPARRVPRRAARRPRRRDGPSGTRPTTPTTCRAGPVACRCGSAWRPTAPTPTPRPSRRRCASPARAPRSCDAAPHLELLVEPELSIVLFRRVGWDAAHVPGVERRAAGPPSSRSSRRRRGAARPCCAGASSTR